MNLLKELTEARLATPASTQRSLPTTIIRKIVRKAAGDNGWEIWDARTDKTRTERRMSFWGSAPKKKAIILNQIKRDLQRGNLPGKVTWHKATGSYGLYDKIVVKVPMEQSTATKEARKHDLRNELRRIQRKGVRLRSLHHRSSPEAKRIREIRELLGQTFPE